MGGGKLTTAPDIEGDFARAFIVSHKRRRVQELLASKKRRKDFLQSLCHFSDFDPQCVENLPPPSQTSEGILSWLRSKGAPDTCYVVSANANLDGRSMLLGDALDAVVGRVPGTVVSCVPGRLAFYEGEASGGRYILTRSRA